MAEQMERPGTPMDAAMPPPLAPTPGAAPPASRRRIVAAAGVIMVGQLLSSVLGMVRIQSLNILFGATAGAFVVALRPIQQVSDLLVGGSVSGALIPTFVDYSANERREELHRVYSTVANLVLLAMALATLVIVVAAPAFVPLYLERPDPARLDLTIALVRITAFSLFGLGLYAVSSGLLYALKSVVFPAFAPGVYHVSIVLSGVVALLLAAGQLHIPPQLILAEGNTPALTLLRALGVRGLAVGAALGTLGQFALLLPGLRRAGIHWRPVLDLGHPAVRQILRLYAPIAAGLLFSVGQQSLDIYLIGHASGDWQANALALQSATTLIQFPTGLVVAALSFAVLPPLTAAASSGDQADFKRILRLGFRLGLLLMVPAMVGLIVLRVPIVGLLFEHGLCGPGCTGRNALALQNYAYQLPFLALDQLLIAAFYARKNTLTPVVVGVLSIAFYLAVALPFYRTVGMPAIALANSALNSGHALVLFVLLLLAIGDPGLRELLGGLLRIGLAALAMAVVAGGLLVALPALAPSLFSLDHFRGQVLVFLLAGGAGALTYFASVIALRVEEVHLLAGILRARLAGGVRT